MCSERKGDREREHNLLRRVRCCNTCCVCMYHTPEKCIKSSIAFPQVGPSSSRVPQGELTQAQP